MRKTRSDSPFASLTEAQLEQLFNWLHEESYKDVRKRVALPPPDGFGIEISIPALGKFYQNRRIELRVQDSLELGFSSENRAQNFHLATREAFAHLAYETAHSPNTAKTLATLANWLSRQEYNDIQRQHLELARSQFNLSAQRLDLDRQRVFLETFRTQVNAARQALENAARLQAVLADDSTDDEDKIHQARGILFQDDAVPQIPRAYPRPETVQNQASTQPFGMSQPASQEGLRKPAPSSNL